MLFQCWYSNEKRENVLFLPIWRSEAETDCDSAGSDDENEGFFHYMHRRLLTAPCSASLKRNLEVTDESTTDVFSDEKALSPVKIETCKKKT